MSEISDKELLTKKLTEEVEDLRAKRSNLETQITALERQKKAEDNVDNVKYQEAKNKILGEISNIKDAVLKERNEWHRKNERLSEQHQMMERNEKELGDVKEKMNELQEERRNVYALRKEANELMRQAKEQWGEIEGFKESQEAMKQNLVAQTKTVKDKEKYYNDLIGEVESKEKAVSTREANCRALEMKHDKKEVTSG